MLLFLLMLHGFFPCNAAPAAYCGEAVKIDPGAPSVFNNRLYDFEKYAEFVDVVSCGYENGNWVFIKSGGNVFLDNRIRAQSEAGLYVLAISKNTVVLNEQYNTFIDNDAGRQFKEGIDNLPHGAFVVVAVKDEATKRFTEEAQHALRKIGAKEGLLGKPFRTSYLCIGMKGLLPGKAIEKVGMEHLRFLGSKSNDKLKINPPAPPPVKKIPQGKSDLQFEMAGLNKGRPVTLWIYRPKKFNKSSDILIVMHGKNRNAETYLERTIGLADRHHALLVAPEFSKRNFPGSERYNRGGMEVLSENYWAFSLIDPIFHYVKSCSKSERTTYKIIGHSAGGQFVHRFVMFKPEARFSLAIAQNAGAYCMLDFRERFPYGLRRQPYAGEDTIKKALSRKLVIMLGEEDTSYLGGSEARKRQGENRVERGKKYMETASACADLLKVEFLWEHYMVPHVGHNSALMIPAADFLLFP